MNHDEEIRTARAEINSANFGFDRPGGPFPFTPIEDRLVIDKRDPLDDASTDMHRAIGAIHDLLRAAKTAKDQGRQGAIYYRVVTLQGFLNALVIDARRDLDALKGFIPL